MMQTRSMSKRNRSDASQEQREEGTKNKRLKVWEITEKTCFSCKTTKERCHYSRRRWLKQNDETIVVCNECLGSNGIPTCRKCKMLLPRKEFLPRELKRTKGAICNSCQRCGNCREPLTLEVLTASFQKKNLRCESCAEASKVWGGKECRKCQKCEKPFPREFFTKAEYKKAKGPGGICSSCKEEFKHDIALKKTCRKCEQSLPREAFSCAQWKKNKHTGSKCQPCMKQEQQEDQCRKCKKCEKSRPREGFSKAQWVKAKSLTGMCVLCQHKKGRREMMEVSVLEASLDFMSCQKCEKTLPCEEFTPDQWKEWGNRQGQGGICVSCQNECIDEIGVIEIEESDKNKENEVSANKEVITDKNIIREKLAERVTFLPKGRERKKFQWSWKSTFISDKDECSMAKRIIKRGHFGPLTKSEKDDLSAFVSTSPRTSMSLSQALSLRSTLLHQKALWSGNLLRQNSTTLLKMYKEGESAVSLAQHYDAPPLNIFRTILSKINLSKRQIRNCLRNPQDKFDLRGQEECEAATNADISARVDNSEKQETADAFEDCVATFLKDKGIAFVRQTELLAEQKEMFGMAICTPDFLILDELVINGCRVAWIDAKAYYGAYIRMNMKGLKEQMSRYVNIWGSGSVLYWKGFSEMVQQKMAEDSCGILNANDFMGNYLLPMTKSKDYIPLS